MKIISLLSLLLVLSFSNLFAQKKSFKNHHPCSFSIGLPSSFRFSNMNEGVSSDYCDYQVQFQQKGISLEVHSLLSSRFESTDINELYLEDQKTIDGNISYQFKSDRFFVLSGTKGGKVFYRKRYFGNIYIADLEIEYLPSQKNLIEKYLGKISGSFKCD